MQTDNPLAGRLPARCWLQVGHTDFVSALAYAPPGLLEGCPGGAVVSGSRDTTVIVWDLQTAQPVQRLEGHEYQVRQGEKQGMCGRHLCATLPA